LESECHTRSSNLRDFSADEGRKVGAQGGGAVQVFLEGFGNLKKVNNSLDTHWGRWAESLRRRGGENPLAEVS